MAIKADFHAHTIYSGDSFLKSSTPRRVLRAAFKKGLDVLAVTDARNDEFFDTVTGNPKKYLGGIRMLDTNGELALFERKGKRLYLFRGMEWHDDDGGHLLQIGGQDKLIYDPSLDMGERIVYAYDKRSLIGLAHPYFKEFGGADEETLYRYYGLVDFLEGFNSLSEPNYNVATQAFAESHGIPWLSNDDEHNCKPGRCHTVLEVGLTEDLDQDSEDIKNAVRKGKILDRKMVYTGFPEKVWIFAVKELIRGNLKPVEDRYRRWKEYRCRLQC